MTRKALWGETHICVLGKRAALVISSPYSYFSRFLIWALESDRNCVQCVPIIARSVPIDEVIDKTKPTMI